MRLLTKLVLGLSLGGACVLSIHGILSVEREERLFQEDKKRDGQLLANAISKSMEQVWTSNGSAEALRFVRQLNLSDMDVDIRWLPMGAWPSCARHSLQKLRDGKPVSLVHQQQGHPHPTLHTFINLDTDDESHGTIEISESLVDKERYVRNSTFRLAVAGLIMVLLNAGLTLVLGHLWVARPIAELVAKTKRVGAEDYASPVLLQSGTEFGQIGTALNIMSDRLVSAQSRRDGEHEQRVLAERQLRHAERLMTAGRLAAGVAHEIGTPLNVISAHAKMIAMGEQIGETAVQGARTIVEQAEHITTIIKQLLGFVRRKGPETQVVNLLALAKKSTQLVHSTARGQGIQLELKPSSNEELYGLVDPNQIQQVLTNLLLNGIHALPRGGLLSVGVQTKYVAPTQHTRLSKNGYCCITVEDNGHGIAPENIDHIFEPFFTTKDVGEGTGLGLSVADGIVRDHHGWIEVTSTVGEGTVFSVYLPKAPGHDT